VNPDPALVSDPLFVLLAWAGGVAAAGSVVTYRSIVGVGFTWLAGATIVLIGVWPAFGGSLLVAAAALAAAAGALVVKVNRPVSGLLLGLSALGFIWAAADLGGPVLAVSAGVALGGITGEMLLGHWYLVDPTLPRLVLRVLAVIGMVGILVDSGLVAAIVGWPQSGFITWVVVILAVTTAGLMAAVFGALRYPAYSGVMAATGLSYLAVLTGLATVFLVRVLATGAGPFGI
jgi:hypothetical protein